MEVELKLEGGSPQLFRRLLRLERLGPYPLGPVERHSILDTYLDTADGLLAARRSALRRRRLDGRQVLTFKRQAAVAGGVFRRQEWEEEETPDYRAFLEREVGLPLAALRPVLRVSTYRRERRVGDAARLSLDTVRYATATFYDLEAELLPGAAPEHLAALRNLLQQAAGGSLRPGRLNKLERGLRLL